MRLKSKRLISLLLAGSMMVSMLPASAVTAFAETTANTSVTSEAAQGVAVTVDSFNTGNLEEAVRDAAKLQNVTDISQITKLTVSGGTMSKTDFEFVSGVHVEGDGYDWNSVTYNGSSMALSNMSTLDLSDTLNETIPARAFNKNTKLVKIVLPKNLKRIEIGAFASMPNLQYLSKDESTNLRFDGVTFMGQSMVNGDKKLTDELQLPSSLKAIGTTCFTNTGVRGDITISGTTDIYNNADYANYSQATPYNRSLFSYTEQNGTGTNIESIKFEHGIEIVPSYIANGCKNLKKVNFSDTVNTIKSYAFYNTGLEGTLVIPQKVSQIEDRAFAFNRNIDNIIIENPNVSLGARVFAAHKNGVKVYLSSAAITAGNDSWNNKDEEHTLAVLLDVNGGTVETDGNGNVTAKLDDTTGLYTPTKDGYKFVGWYNGETELNGAAEAGKTYTAKWEAKQQYTVSFDLNGQTGTVPATQTVYEEDPATKPADPTAKGYKFIGWVDANGNAFDFTKPVTANTTLYAKWEAIPDHQLTVTGGTFTVKDENVETKTEGDTLMADIPEGAEVTVTLNKDAYADSNLTFDGWKIEGLVDAENYTNKEEFTFTMPKNGVTIEALTKAKAAAPAEDDSMDAATVVTGVVLGTGTAILAYHIGTEVYAEQVLGEGVAVPKTREDVALKAWELAGKPAVELNGEPLSEAAQAEKWAVESGLMQNDANGSFNGAKKMNKLKALRVLDAAKKLA